MRLETDKDLVEKIRNNFDVENVVAELFANCEAMAECVGVKVTWRIESVDKGKKVESSKLAKLLGRLTTLGGAFCLGGHLNPIQSLKKRERDAKVQRQTHRQTTGGSQNPSAQ